VSMLVTWLRLRLSVCGVSEVVLRCIYGVSMCVSMV